MIDGVFFMLQKLTSRLLFPVPLTLILGLLGLLLIARRRAGRMDTGADRENGARVRSTSRLGLALTGAAFAFLWLASTAPVSDALLWSLEGRYPPIAQSLAFSGGAGAVDGAEGSDGAEDPHDLNSGFSLVGSELIVVLGAGHAEREGFGPWASLGESARARVIEGVRLSRRFDLPLLFTGYAGTGEVSTAEMNSRAALELGIAPERIAVNSEPRNTAEEAAAVREALAGEVDVAGAADQATNNAIDDAEPRVILVTSASHMPRSVYLFEREGVAVLPAPADYRAASRNYSIWGLLPSAGALRNTERAWYEYLGLAWARIGG